MPIQNKIFVLQWDHFKKPELLKQCIWGSAKQSAVFTGCRYLHRVVVDGRIQWGGSEAQCDSVGREWSPVWFSGEGVKPSDSEGREWSSVGREWSPVWFSGEGVKPSMIQWGGSEAQCDSVGREWSPVWFSREGVKPSVIQWEESEAQCDSVGREWSPVWQLRRWEACWATSTWAHLHKPGDDGCNEIWFYCSLVQMVTFMYFKCLHGYLMCFWLLH